MPAYAFAIYNFSQVSDAVLLVMADKKQQKLTMIFTYCDGCWQTSEDLSFLNAESFQQINNALTGLAKSNVYSLSENNLANSKLAGLVSCYKKNSSFSLKYYSKHIVCCVLGMTNENPVRFTLDNDIKIIVKKVANNKYDFELILPNGSRKTFVWDINMPLDYADKKGNPDVLVIQTIKKFQSIINNNG